MLRQYADSALEAFGGDYPLLWILVALLIFLQMAALVFMCIMYFAAVIAAFASWV